MSNPQFVKIGVVSDLPQEGEAREFTVDGRAICVAKVQGEYCAMDNVCPHEGGPLSMGFVEGNKIVCSWHGWEFDARTGKIWETERPGVAVYQLRVEGDSVMVATEAAPGTEGDR